MTTSEDSRAWIKEHRDRYIATNGADGHDWKDVTALLLTTTGRQSGELYTTPLIYGQDGDRYLVVASKGGAPRHPHWYLNLASDADVEVQVKGDKFAATARPATPEEKPALWKIMTDLWPAYDEYQSRTDRQIPLIILERA